MKKSIIVIALALLMVASVFADTVSNTVDSAAVEKGQSFTSANNKTQTTEVNVSLELSPKYAFGVTGGDSKSTVEGTYAQKFLSYGTDGDKIVAVAPSDDTKTAGSDYYLYDTLDRVTVISMVADEENMVIKEPANNDYYVSYWFFENDTKDVNLTISLSGDLTLTDESKKKITDAGISFDEAKSKIPYQITVAAKDGSKTITSSSNESVVVATADVTMEVGKVQVGDAQLEVQTLGDVAAYSIETKYVGLYKSNIILNLTVGA